MSASQSGHQIPQIERPFVHEDTSGSANQEGCLDWPEPPEAIELQKILTSLRQKMAEDTDVKRSSIALSLLAADLVNTPSVRNDGKTSWRPIAFQNIWNTVPMYGRIARKWSGDETDEIDETDKTGWEGIFSTEKRLDKSQRDRGFWWREQVKYVAEFSFGKKQEFLLSILFCGGVKFEESTLADKSIKIRETFKEHEVALEKHCSQCANPLLKDERLRLLAGHLVKINHSPSHYQQELTRFSPTQDKDSLKSSHNVVEERHREALNAVLREKLGDIIQILMDSWEEQGNAEKPIVWGSVRAVEIEIDRKEKNKPPGYGAWIRASYLSLDDPKDPSFEEAPDRIKLEKQVENYGDKSEANTMGLIAWSSIYQRPLLVPDLFTSTGCVPKCWNLIYQPTFQLPEARYPKEWRNIRAKSEVVIPIILDTGDTWGVLNLESDTSMFFKPHDVDFLYVCARLIATSVEEHLQCLMDEHTTVILRELTESRDKVESAPEGQNSATKLPERIAKLLHAHLCASQVTLTPWGSLWPISAEEIAPILNASSRRSTTSLGLSNQLLKLVGEEQKKSLSLDQGDQASQAISHYRTFGVWLNADNDDNFRESTYFKVDLASKDVSPPDAKPTPSPDNRWKMDEEDRHHSYRTFIGVPIFMAPDVNEQSRGRATSNPIAVCWIKYNAYVPFSKIKVREIAQLVRLLSIHLWHHQVTNTLQFPGVDGTVFTHDALEYYLKRAQEKKHLSPQVAALIDMDDLRGMNSRRGYAVATKIIHYFLRQMNIVCSEMMREFKETIKRMDDLKKKHSPRELFIDVFRYGGDEFMLVMRIVAGDYNTASENDSTPPEVKPEALLEEWEKKFRKKLKDADVNREGGSFDDADFKKAWKDEKPSFSCGATFRLGELLDQLKNHPTPPGQKKPEPPSRWVLNHLGVCLRVAKHLGKRQTIIYEKIARLVNSTLYEYYRPAWEKALSNEIAKNDQTGELCRWPIHVEEVLSESWVVLPVGDTDGVEPGMRFAIVFDVGKYTKTGDMTNSAFDPRLKAEVEVVEVWKKRCLAQLSRPGVSIKPCDMVILKRE